MDSEVNKKSTVLCPNGLKHVKLPKISPMHHLQCVIHYLFTIRATIFLLYLTLHHYYF